MGLHDFLMGRCLSTMPHIPHTHRAKTEVIVKACHELTSANAAQDPNKKSQIAEVARVLETTQAALTAISEASVMKKKAQLTEEEITNFLSHCETDLIKGMEHIVPEKAKVFTARIEKAKAADIDKALKKQKASKILSVKLDKLSKTPKAYLEFWVWDAYSANEDQKYVYSRPQLTVEMDTSIPVVWTYFLGLMRQKDRPLSIADNPLFYEAFPAKPSKRKPIDPITFESKLQEFASRKSFSSNQPLVVHVLLDRKASVSFEIAPSKFLVVTNIFRLSSDASFPRPRVVLREKSGILYHEGDVEEKIYPYSSNPATSKPPLEWKCPQSPGREPPKFESWKDTLYAIMDKPEQMTWRCSWPQPNPTPRSTPRPSPKPLIIPGPTRQSNAPAMPEPQWPIGRNPKPKTPKSTPMQMPIPEPAPAPPRPPQTHMPQAVPYSGSPPMPSGPTSTGPIFMNPANTSYSRLPAHITAASRTHPQSPPPQIAKDKGKGVDLTPLPSPPATPSLPRPSSSTPHKPIPPPTITTKYQSPVGIGKSAATIVNGNVAAASAVWAPPSTPTPITPTPAAPATPSKPKGWFSRIASYVTGK